MKTQILLFLSCLSLASAQTAEEWIAQGDAFDASLKTDDALKAYLKAEALTPNDAALLIKIAKQYGESMVDASGTAAKLKVGEQALAYAKRAVAITPNSCDAHLAVAICYGRILDLVPPKTKVEYSRLVKQHADKAVALDPKSDYAWHMLGRWHQAVCDLNGLLRSLVKIVYGGLPDASLEEAADCFQKAERLRPDRVAHPIELGRTYAMQGKKKEAKEAIERGLALKNQERDDPETKARGEVTLKKL